MSDNHLLLVILCFFGMVTIGIVVDEYYDFKALELNCTAEGKGVFDANNMPTTEYKGIR